MGLVGMIWGTVSTHHRIFKPAWFFYDVIQMLVKAIC